MKMTERGALALFYCQRYGLMTAEQLAHVEGVSLTTARNTFVELGSYVGSFGNVGLVGRGKAPKVYYITQKGFEALKRDSNIPVSLIGSFRQSKGSANWSAKMFHRIDTVTALLCAEQSASNFSHFDIVKTFIEYRRERVNNTYQAETSDKYNNEAITPDGSFIVENLAGKRFLFMLELDRGTERITSKIAGLSGYSLENKFNSYDEYLKSGAYANKYSPWGSFDFFQMLFITTTDKRIRNIKNRLSKIDSSLDDYFYFTTLSDIREKGFFSNVWQQRNNSDNTLYTLVGE